MLFVSAMRLIGNALHKINCVTACKSICYTIYNILCNAFPLVGRFLSAVARVTFGRATALQFCCSMPQNCTTGIATHSSADEALCFGLAYNSPSCCYMLGGPERGHKWPKRQRKSYPLFNSKLCPDY